MPRIGANALPTHPRSRGALPLTRNEKRNILPIREPKSKGWMPAWSRLHRGPLGILQPRGAIRWMLEQCPCCSGPGAASARQTPALILESGGPKKRWPRRWRRTVESTKIPQCASQPGGQRALRSLYRVSCLCTLRLSCFDLGYTMEGLLHALCNSALDASSGSHLRGCSSSPPAPEDQLRQASPTATEWSFDIRAGSDPGQSRVNAGTRPPARDACARSRSPSPPRR
jgi:hypothetical protein